MMAVRRSFLAGLFLIAGALVVLSPAGRAQDATADFTADAATAIKALTDRGVSIVQDKQMTIEARRAAFQQLFSDGFDVPTIGRFVLGRYWRTASEEQKKEFLTLFEAMVVQTYTNRFTQYSGEQFKVVASRMDQNSAVVLTDVLRPSQPEPIKVEWRTLKSATGVKIVDVIVEGVSMSVTQQQDYGSMIQRSGNGLDGLIAELRQRTQQNRQG